MNLKVEYLIIIDKESSPGLYSLCEDEISLRKLITTDSPVSINEDTICYNNTNMGKFVINTDLIKEKNQRYFYLSCIFDGEEKAIVSFSKMLHTLKSKISEIGWQVETIWDDISLFYSKLAYEEIHKIENLMRKLITYFMVTNFGKNWINDNSPSSVKEVIGKSKRQHYQDILHQVDFIHLGDFLFKTYQKDGINFLLQKIDTAGSISELNLDELKQLLVKSNWDRFFAKVVACDDKYLKNRWDELYEFRCKVAHNTILRKDDLERIIILVKEVENKLNAAINNIQKIEVTPEEKERVAENVASSFSFSRKDVLKMIENGTILLDKNDLIDELLNETSVTWKDEVSAALIYLGGEATLDQIYAQIENNTSRSLSPTWKATIRRTLQQHSSDTETYKGGEDLFEHVASGVWKLRGNV